MCSLELVRIGINDRRVSVFLVLIVGNSAVLIELKENVFLTFTVNVSSAHLFAVFVHIFCERTIFLRALRDSSKYRCFGSSKLGYIFAEILGRSKLDTVYSAAEADVVEVFFEYLVLRVGLLKLHGTEYLTYLTLRRMLIITCEVFDKLLRYSRTTLFCIVDMQEHIHESREGTLIVNTVMRIETLVLGIDECIADVLRYFINRNRNTLNIGFDTVYNG